MILNMAFVFNIAPLAGYMDTGEYLDSTAVCEPVLTSIVQNDTTPSSSSRSVSPVEFQEPPPAYHTIFSTTNTGTDNERPPSRALAIATHNSNGGSEDSETMREQHFNNQRASFSFTRNIDLEAQRIPRPTAQNTRRTGRSNRGQDVAVSKKIPYKELLWMA